MIINHNINYFASIALEGTIICVDVSAEASVSQQNTRIVTLILLNYLIMLRILLSSLIDVSSKIADSKYESITSLNLTVFITVATLRK